MLLIHTNTNIFSFAWYFTFIFLLYDLVSWQHYKWGYDLLIKSWLCKKTYIHVDAFIFKDLNKVLANSQLTGKYSNLIILKFKC